MPDDPRVRIDEEPGAIRTFACVLAIGALALVGAPGCSDGKADRFDGAQTDVATLRKVLTLQPAPAEAEWSVATIGTDAVFGPTDTALWAVVRYSDADFAAVSRALKVEGSLRSVTMGALPAWLLADVDLTRYRHGSGYVFQGPVSAGGPFASDLYATGFALTLPDRRVLIHFSSR